MVDAKEEIREKMEIVVGWLIRLRVKRLYGVNEEEATSMLFSNTDNKEFKLFIKDLIIESLEGLIVGMVIQHQKKVSPAPPSKK